ncbi:M13 family metallopeptidase [Parahaliea maris]|nr:M13 family metallopeptidase [Parahaliea maris]
MDLSADPRKDFTRYAIGGWLDHTEIPDDKLQITAANALLDTLDERLLTIARSAADATTDRKKGNVQLVGDLYTSGMDMKARDERGTRPIQDFLAAVEAAETPAQIAEVSARMELELGSSPFFSVEVGPDSKDRHLNSLRISTDVGSRGFLLNRNEYTSENNQAIRDQNVATKATLFEMTGDSPEVAQQRAVTVMAIEQALAAGTMTPVQASDPVATYNSVTIDKLQAMLPAIDMGVYFKALGVTPPESVIVTDPESIKSMQETLAGLSGEDLKSLMRSHVIWKSASLLGSNFHDILNEYQRVKYGLPKMPPMEKEIVGAIGVLMAHPISRLYVEEYFDPAQRNAVVDMMARIQTEFRHRIDGNAWLTDSTKATAAAKLAKIQVKVGYPENEDDWIDYSDVAIAADDFYGNINRLREFNKRRNLAQLGRPVEIDQFTVPGKITPISMNAAIHQGFLVVYVTAAFIQPPYYVKTNDAAANFGSLGAVVGHELTHAFDSKGRNYDVSGNLNDWWTPEDAAEFKKRAEVLVGQYNEYEVAPGVKVNGALTLSENIADLGGMTLAYNALQTYMKENGRLPDQDGLSPEQRFFIAWAQAWMAKSRVEALKMLVATDPHSPSEVRSFGPAVNMDGFYQAFGITEGDPMWKAPEERVTIW